jgi:hypothetical protein
MRRYFALHIELDRWVRVNRGHPFHDNFKSNAFASVRPFRDVRPPVLDDGVQREGIHDQNPETLNDAFAQRIESLTSPFLPRGSGNPVLSAIFFPEEMNRIG